MLPGDRIESPWPQDGLERVPQCPYCGSDERTLAHRSVQDWSFYAAPGRWDYWSCVSCESLYLDPRPTASALPLAYRSYYTHEKERPSIVDRLRQRMRNECWTAFYGVELSPRLHLPMSIRWALAPLRRRLSAPFHIEELSRLAPGRLLDVGSGGGDMLDVATKLGWQAKGLELDPSAVRASGALGLDVEEGSFERLKDFPQSFDCIICSHVLEHVASPRLLLELASRALRPNGVLLLASPNATSLMRTRFRDNWRGLEAPRHLSIPSSRRLSVALREAGFEPTQRHGRGSWTATAAESIRIARRGVSLVAADYAAAARIEVTAEESTLRNCDFAEFVCVRRSAGD